MLVQRERESGRSLIGSLCRSRIVVILSAGIVVSAGVLGQSKDAPAFDIVSVHPAQPVEGQALAALRETISPGPESLTMRNVTLASTIRWAYNLRPFELSGPDRLNDKRFDVAGKAADRRPKINSGLCSGRCFRTVSNWQCISSPRSSLDSCS